MKQYRQNEYAPQRLWLPDLQHAQAVGLQSWYPFDGINYHIEVDRLRYVGGISRGIDTANGEGARRHNGDCVLALREPAVSGNMDLPQLPYTDVPISISLWSAPTITPVGADVFSWIGHSSWNAFYFGCDTSGGGFVHVQSLVFSGTNDFTPPTLGALVHYVGVVESYSSVKLYRNGVLVSTGTDTLTPSGVSKTLFRLNESGPTGHGSNLIIRDHRVYNRALTDAEVWALYDPATRYAMQRETIRRRSYSYLPVAGNPRLGDQHHVLAI